MPDFNKGDFTQQGVAGHVNAILRLNEKRLVNIDLTSNEEDEGCTISGTVTDLLNDKVYNIESGGGDEPEFCTLLKTLDLGTLSTTSTTAVTTGQDLILDLEEYKDYNFFLFVAQRTEQLTNHHFATMSALAVQYSTGYPNVSGATTGVFRYNAFVDSDGLTKVNYAQSARGVFIPDSGSTFADKTLTVPINMAYNGTYTKAIDGDYMGYVYGLKLLPNNE